MEKGEDNVRQTERRWRKGKMEGGVGNEGRGGWSEREGGRMEGGRSLLLQPHNFQLSFLKINPEATSCVHVH